MIKTAIVILNWNGRNFLEKFLPSVIKYSPSATIFVADNCSTDGSIPLLKEVFPEVKVIQNSCNAGFSEGYNLALQQIQAEYYILLNSDVEVTEQWLDPLIQLMDSDSSIGACQPKIKSFFHKDYFEYAGAAGGFIDKLCYPFCRGRLFETLEKDEGQYNDTKEIFWATGACMVVRAQVYHQIGGLDKDFFAHMEEIDLCWRLHKNGYKVYYCGRSEVYHVGGGSLSKTSPRKTYLNFRNNIALLVKNYPSKNFWFVLFLRLVLDGVAGVKFLVTSGPGHFFAVIRAHFYIYQNIGSLRKKRNYLKPFNKNPFGIYPRSIVWDYYVSRKKKFQDLIF